jgi:2-polyprenyl-3-methyl-5-hydroxy-6-metoxy-1,4-benzoquinol methylase
MSDRLVKMLGWRATMIHGDAMVLDRWLWLRRHLPLAQPSNAKFLDVGCGSGAFTLGAALRSYDATGLSWDERNQAVAQGRATLLGLETITFPICDVRKLDQRMEFLEAFDIALCSENIEHILDDDKLIRDIHACLKPGGRLCLSTPNFDYYPLEEADKGPFANVEDGRHVRRGYTPAMLRELCDRAGFEVEEIGYVSYYFSQQLTSWARLLNKWFGQRLGWAIVLPLRLIPLLFDGWLGKWIGYALGRSGFSIVLVAFKKRFPSKVDSIVDAPC